MSDPQTEEKYVLAVLEAWAKATRDGRKDKVLQNHVAELVIFDVLPPMKYESAESYRRSWDDWQPEVQGAMQFDLENVAIHAGPQIAFAHCFIRCGGTLPDGQTFEDVVRATFCLEKISGQWKISHQHVSKPFQQSRLQ
ncbi:MAG: nuclear transport factor 2 family protein [Polaromonas sp.]|nr:nuclear transport factor 2 family protein [Polaromonas sp.]